MSSKTSHRAFVITETKRATDQKSFFHDAGVVWPPKSGEAQHRDPRGISISCRIVCTERQEKE
jgi:hypothetical protein